MSPLHKAALAAACAASLAGNAQAAIAIPATASPAPASDYIHRTGYYLPSGAYVVTCHAYIVAYTRYGRPIWRRACG